jgi:hypothetical protein
MTLDEALFASVVLAPFACLWLAKLWWRRSVRGPWEQEPKGQTPPTDPRIARATPDAARMCPGCGKPALPVPRSGCCYCCRRCGHEFTDERHGL